MTETLTIPPVVKSVRLPCPPAVAFQAFTEEFGAWWPFHTHSLGGEEKVAKVVFEGGPQGRVYEVWTDGEEHPWGRVLAWDPPHSVTFSWHVGHDPAEASQVRITVTPDGAGSIVELVHSGWERLGDQGAGMREGYNSGWIEVFERKYGGYAQAR